MSFIEVREGSWWQLEHIESIEFGVDSPPSPTVVRFFSGVEEWIDSESAKRIIRALREPQDPTAVEED